MFFVHWEQHPVGHGGFHTGRLNDTASAPFTWAFDCGARASAVFDTYLRNWTLQHQLPLDWLFISHFDNDHVSGLDTLMTRTVVRDVMIPYLNERELALLLLDAVARDRLSRSIVDLTADPAAFFLSRGAERVTFLGSDGRSHGPEVPPIDPDGAGGDRPWRCKISPPPRPLAAPPWAARASSVPTVRTIDSGVCDVSIIYQSYGLRLKPYRAPVQTQMRRSLIKAMKKLVGRAVVPLAARPGLGGLAYAVANHARTSTGRASLRLLHKTFAGSSNRASLSLLSEPIIFNDQDTGWWVRSSGRWRDGSGKGVPAWINTGDAELLATADLADWRAAYAPELANVRVLALPHHGSDRNSGTHFQALCPDALLVAHVKSTAKKHPGPAVTIAAGSRLAQVTEQAGSAVTMTFHSP